MATLGVIEPIDMFLTANPSVVNLTSVGGNPNANGDGINSYKGDTTGLDPAVVTAPAKKKPAPPPPPKKISYWWLLLLLIPIGIVVYNKQSNKNKKYKRRY